MNSSIPRIWAVSDGRAGNVAMAQGLAERVAALTGGSVVRRDLDVGGVRAWFAARLPWFPSRLQMATYPSPQLVIGAGRRIAPAVASLGRTGVKTVQILDPQMAHRHFDLVVAPEHDDVNAPNTLTTLGSVNRVTDTLLNEAVEEWGPKFSSLPRPLTAVLIGGATKRTALKEDAVDRLAQDLRTLSTSTGLLITASRRTGEAQTARLREAVPDAWFWDGEGDNPYFGLLG